MIQHVVTTTHLQFLTLFFLQIQVQNSQAHAANHAARRMPPEEALAASHEDVIHSTTRTKGKPTIY